MIRIVADDKIPFLRGALEKVARVEYVPGGRISREHLVSADGLITRTRTMCNSELLEGTQVRFIASATIGYDHIDTGYCKDAGIGWTNAPGCNSSSVEQYLVSLLLWLANRDSLDLSQLTLGVIGAGNVGSKVARAAGALGMKVLLNDPPRQRAEGEHSFVSLDEIRRRADIVTMHVPLNRGGTDNTLHMVNEEFILGLKRGTLLINTSRGPVVDEASLIRGIRNGIIADAVLDVFEGEPDISGELMEAATLVTPHIAGYSLDGKANGTAMSVQAVSRFFGLGLDQWTPENIPLPPVTELHGDAESSGLYQLLWELYRQTYDITRDDRRLRIDPGTFEEIRGSYPLRREPGAYSVKVFQPTMELSEIIEGLGFSMLRDTCL